VLKVLNTCITGTIPDIYFYLNGHKKSPHGRAGALSWKMLAKM